MENRSIRVLATAADAIGGAILLVVGVATVLLAALFDVTRAAVVSLFAGLRVTRPAAHAR